MSVEVVDVRTGRGLSLTLDIPRLQVVVPDHTSDRATSAVEFGLEQVVLAGPIAGRFRGRRGAWAITRSVGLDDPRWGASAPAWSWLLAPEDSSEARRAGERFLHHLRSALPKQRWVSKIKLSREARDGVCDPAGELLELARGRDPEFATTCAAVSEERDRRAARRADEAERMLLDSLRWHSTRPANATR